MPPKKYARRLDDVVERAVDVGLDAVFDRVSDFFRQQEHDMRSTTAQLPQELRRPSYKCAGCHNMFPFEGVAMVSSKGDGFAVCERCFKFMWVAADEKMRILKEGIGNFAKNQRAATPPQPAQPRRPPPWEVLGVDADASVDEIKKAYRKAAAAAHPDRVPPGAPDSEKEAARARFEELTRCYNAMMNVRRPAT